ncbi:hypothetical protein [Wenzhouxiangella sp. XN79A]|uniref:hypothetical protein n=1 Tax=Wenzhouxiangella sp. XN79A TaxID=2724193 RepID=UPI003217990D
MKSNHAELKARHREERHAWHEYISLRVHRALSWLNRAEQCEDEDGRFIFLWIAFNAAYAHELGEYRELERRTFGRFLSRLVELDRDGEIESVLWQQFPGPVRVLLGNKYVFQPFWNHHNHLPDSDDWEERFNLANRAANRAIAARDIGKLLGIVFARLYTLRNQLVHGGATWNSQVNRDQLRDANAIMGTLVPLVIRIMMDNAGEYWGEPCYPVV